MAFKRDEICRSNKVPSGPVLFTDFAGLSSVEGSLCSISFFIDVSRDFLFLLFHFYFVTDELSHKLKLLKEVALDLSKGEDRKVVIWVFNSFSTLVTNVTKDLAANNS
jgi:hypothetical protein